MGTANNGFAVAMASFIGEYGKDFMDMQYKQQTVQVRYLQQIQMMQSLESNRKHSNFSN